MKNNKFKFVLIVFFAAFICFLGSNKVNAANASISVKSSQSTVVVGGSFNVTVTVYSSGSIGAWEYNLMYDTSKLQLTSGTQHIADYASGSGKTSATYNYKFKAKSSGSANINVQNSSVADWNENMLSVTNGSSSVKIITQEQLESSYSKNNNLKELSVEGATLTPEFNKDTLEYAVELEPETTSIKINATKEDSKASITGDGEITVSEGDNKLEIKVAAQNGSVKTYIINAKVKELAPINITIDKNKYTVVRKKDALTKPILFEETTIKMGEEEVPAFKNEKSKYTLIGLKDEEGNINLYIYENKKGKESFTLYDEFISTTLTFSPLTANDIPKEYEKTTIKIGDKKVTAYKSSKTSKFALIYGMNVENGEKGWYSYDLKENTIQRYNADEVDILNKKINQNFIIIAILGGMIGIFLILMIVVLIKKLSKNKKNSNIIKDKIDIKELTKNSKNKTL